MRKFKTIIIFIIILTFSVGFTNSKDWQLLELEDFQIEFPKKTDYQTKIINSPIGNLKMHIYMYDSSQDKKDDNLVYGVMFIEYPDTIVNSDSKEDLTPLFKNSVDGAVNNVNGKLLSESVIELDGFPGREIKVDFKDGLAIIKMRIYLVKSKLFIIQTITKTKNYSNKSIDKFMDSFKLKL